MRFMNSSLVSVVDRKQPSIQLVVVIHVQASKQTRRIRRGTHGGDNDGSRQQGRQH
jgi:hypothetical protein